VQNFASLSAPLTDLMTIKRRFSLTPEAIKAFESPDYAKPFAIHCICKQNGCRSGVSSGVGGRR